MPRLHGPRPALSLSLSVRPPLVLRCPVPARGHTHHGGAGSAATAQGKLLLVGGRRLYLALAVGNTKFYRQSDAPKRLALTRSGGLGEEDSRLRACFCPRSSTRLP